MSDHAAAAPHSAEDAAPKTSILPKILVSGFIASVIVVETLLFFMFVSLGRRCGCTGRSQLDQKSPGRHGRTRRRGPSKTKTKPSNFRSAISRPPLRRRAPDRTYRVEFRLFGTVKAKDLEHLEELYAERAMRFRHRLMLEVRNATMDELNENQLGLIQRRILATSIEILEEPILLGVGFQDYQVIEE